MLITLLLSWVGLSLVCTLALAAAAGSGFAAHNERFLSKQEQQSRVSQPGDKTGGKPRAKAMLSAGEGRPAMIGSPGC